MNWSTFRGNNSAILSFASLLNGDLRGNNLLPKEQILFFKIRPHLENALSSREANTTLQKVLSFSNKAGSMEVYPFMFSR